MEISKDLKEKFNIAVEACDEVLILSIAKSAIDYHYTDRDDLFFNIERVGPRLATFVESATKKAAIAVCDTSVAVFNDAFAQFNEPLIININKDDLMKVASTIRLYILLNTKSITDPQKIDAHYIEAPSIAAQAIALAMEAYIKDNSNVLAPNDITDAAANSAAYNRISAHIVEILKNFDK